MAFTDSDTKFGVCEGNTRLKYKIKERNIHL